MYRSKETKIDPFDARECAYITGYNSSAKGFSCVFDGDRTKRLGNMYHRRTLSAISSGCGASLSSHCLCLRSKTLPWTPLLSTNFGRIMLFYPPIKTTAITD